MKKRHKFLPVKFKIKCECCRRKIATIKDYREGDLGNINKMFVCNECFGLNAVDFYKKMNHIKR